MSLTNLPIEILELIAFDDAFVMNSLLRVHRPLSDRIREPGMKKLYSDAVTQIVVSNSNTFRIVAGRLHAIDQPSLTCTNGTCYYHYDGKIHRDDGPAGLTATGGKKYCKHGKFHRLDGPALDGWGRLYNFYCIEGERFGKNVDRYNNKLLEMGLPPVATQKG